MSQCKLSKDLVNATNYCVPRVKEEGEVAIVIVEIERVIRYLGCPQIFLRM